MLFESLRKQRFWIEWERKFLGSSGNPWIVPGNPSVKNAAKRAVKPSSVTESEMVDDVWRWVDKNIKYKLTKEWQRPPELLITKVGDCEDMSFLIASMLHSLGVEESKLLTGYVVRPSGKKMPHVWNEVNGEFIDGTVPHDNTRGIVYEVMDEYEIVTENYGQGTQD